MEPIQESAINDNKRKTEREVAAQGAIKTVAKRADGGVLSGTVGDLSYEGVKVVGDTTGLAIGEELLLGIHFPLGHDAEYRCVVRHVGADSYGVEILERIDSEAS